MGLQVPLLPSLSHNPRGPSPRQETRATPYPVHGMHLVRLHQCPPCWAPEPLCPAAAQHLKPGSALIMGSAKGIGSWRTCCPLPLLGPLGGRGGAGPAWLHCPLQPQGPCGSSLGIGQLAGACPGPRALPEPSSQWSLLPPQPGRAGYWLVLVLGTPGWGGVRICKTSSMPSPSLLPLCSEAWSLSPAAWQLGLSWQRRGGREGEGDPGAVSALRGPRAIPLRWWFVSYYKAGAWK